VSRSGRDVPLSRVTDVSSHRTLWERIVRSGTVTVASVGDGGPLVLRRVPDSQSIQTLLTHLVEAGADLASGPYPDGPHEPASCPGGSVPRSHWV
jgi:hypothetical protein